MGSLTLGRERPNALTEVTGKKKSLGVRLLFMITIGSIQSALTRGSDMRLLLILAFLVFSSPAIHAMAEQDFMRFKVDANELASRKRWTAATKSTVANAERAARSVLDAAKRRGPAGFDPSNASGYDQGIAAANDDYLNREADNQQLLMRKLHILRRSSPMKPQRLWLIRAMQKHSMKQFRVFKTR